MATGEEPGCTLPAGLHELGAEVVDLLYAQASEPGALRTESEVCRAFSELLLARWELDCVAVFLRDEEVGLRLCDAHAREGVGGEAAARAAEVLARAAVAEGRESQVLAGPTEGGAEGEAGEAGGVRAAFGAAGARAGVAVPIRARGAFIGALVALASRAEPVQEAVAGVRFVGPPLVIALGNARRAGAMDEQRSRIEQLVAELRERTAALEAANRELRGVSRYRSLFLSRMSHELRTPLTSVLGFTEILLEHGDLNEWQARCCEKIQSQGQRLRATVNQLVDLSRLEAGQTELFLHEFSVRETMRESCEAVSRLAEKQGVAVACEIDPACGTIVSDEGKLRQVFYNLLAHAIGRSPAGAAVRVAARRRGGERLAIEIADEGEPVDDATHLFEPADVDPPSEQSTNLNELGLAIAHRLVGALGGTVAPATDAGARGLTVHLEIPTCPTEN
jgi:signal transduction histidine kinase